jgi:thymidylate synthase (FAD)
MGCGGGKMKVVKQSHQVLYPVAGDFASECKLIEAAGRTAYKSESLISEDSYKQFVKKMVNMGHLAVIEFGNMAVRFVTSRGVTHELVRHRLCSFVQESTRYVNYAGGAEFVEPSTFDSWDLADKGYWRITMGSCESAYRSMVENGLKPGQARAVLPNDLKTEIVVKANFREWRHIFQLRAISKAAHPDIRALLIPLYEECREAVPEIFDMGDVEHS